MEGVREDTRRSTSGDRQVRLRRGTALVWALALAGGTFACGWGPLADCAYAQLPGDPLELSQPSAGTPDATIAFPGEGEPLVDVLIEGNATIQEQAIRQLIKSRPGRPPSPEQIRDDITALYRKKWFFNVEALYRRTDQGLVLVFKVLERPWVTKVEYLGNSKIKTKHLAAQTGLKPGSPFDVSTNRQAAERLREFYNEKGYSNAKVELVKGGSRDDREVVFQIEEGDIIRVSGIKFSGNDSFSDAILKTKTQTETAIVGLMGGKFNPESLPNDIAAVKQYYHGLGYFEVAIEKEVTFGRPWWNPFIKNTTYAEVEYKIVEGPRYKVRRIGVEGNRVLSEDDLRKDSELAEGDYFNSRFLEKDMARMKEMYGELGRPFASVEATPVYLEEPGIVDVALSIDESQVYAIRRIDVVINGDYPHTKRSAVLNRILLAPGDLANPQLLRKSERRLEGDGIFERGPQNGPKLTLKRVEPDFSESLASNVRGQTAESDDSRRASAPDTRRARATAVSRATVQQTGSLQPAPTPSQSGANDSDAEKHAEVDAVFRGQSFGDPLPTPFNPIYENYADEPDPLAPSELPPGEVDVLVNVSEARTGRIMFGAGVNSDAGVVGQVVLTEDNFDITRFPRSFQDFVDGTAFRGAGQRFRVEAVPGNVVSRYLVNWTDPYFLDTDYSLGFSGFYYNRFFPDWDEGRTGMRVTIGRQLSPTISVNGAFRLEQVEIDNPAVPTPASLTDVLGSNLLTTFRAAVVHDTRDSAFLPSEGHRLEASFEQAIGDFLYPRAEVEGSQFFTLYSRPDGAGKHILTLRGNVGWTDSGTPIFEKFFAGGFQTFRGFDFRGVTPREFDVGVGGQWLTLGTVEYMFPLLANEMIHGVVFSDFGTVEEDVSLSDFRVTAGGGLRVTVPAMGPVPLAFDWAVPIVKQDEDDTRLFSFYVGINR